MAAMACAPVIRSKRFTVKSARLRIYEGASDVQKFIIARSELSSAAGADRVETWRLVFLPISIRSPATSFRRSINGRSILLDRPEFQYPEHLNAAVELTDRHGRAWFR